MNKLAYLWLEVQDVCVRIVGTVLILVLAALSVACIPIEALVLAGEFVYLIATNRINAFRLWKKDGELGILLFKTELYACWFMAKGLVLGNPTICEMSINKIRYVLKNILSDV